MEKSALLSYVTRSEETIMKKVKQYIMSLDHSNKVKCDASACQTMTE